MWLDRAKQWVLVGFLLCPAELQRPQALLLLRAVLADTWFLPIFREQYLEIHTPYVFGDAKKEYRAFIFCLCENVCIFVEKCSYRMHFSGARLHLFQSLVSRG